MSVCPSAVSTNRKNDIAALIMHGEDFLINWNTCCSRYLSQLKWHVSIRGISTQTLVTCFPHLMYLITRMKPQRVWSRKKKLRHWTLPPYSLAEFHTHLKSSLAVIFILFLIDGIVISRYDNDYMVCSEGNNYLLSNTHLHWPHNEI